uniref:Protein CUSTOS n=1 Tax=Eptatretus burgeri TaxID=7764 RepID=A0A8C4QRP5_EPTBU
MTSWRHLASYGVMTSWRLLAAFSVMAASTCFRTIAICGDSDRSSEDNESIKRLKEATAGVRWMGSTATAWGRQGERRRKHSGRICFQDDDQGTSELQSTPEFRSHVAKKLGEALDRLIKISGAARTPLSCEHSPQESGDGDDSFRLFSSSVPGCHPASPVAPKRRRQTSVPSSDEDSDAIEHQHLVESAVSGEEIIRNGALHALYQPRASPSMTVKRIHDKNKNKMSKESTTTIKSSAAAKQIMLDRDSRRIDLGGKKAHCLQSIRLPSYMAFSLPPFLHSAHFSE